MFKQQTKGFITKLGPRISLVITCGTLIVGELLGSDVYVCVPLWSLAVKKIEPATLLLQVA